MSLRVHVAMPQEYPRIRSVSGGALIGTARAVTSEFARLVESLARAQPTAVSPAIGGSLERTMARWYYNDGTTQHGPMELEALRDKRRTGTCQASFMVWCEGWPNWTQASEVKELDRADASSAPAAVKTRSASLPRVSDTRPTPRAAADSASKETAPHQAAAPIPAPAPGLAASTDASATRTPAVLTQIPTKFEAVMDKGFRALRPIASEARVDRIDGFAQRVGTIAGLVAVGLAGLSGAIGAIKLERMSPLMDAMYLVVFGLVTLYVGQRLVHANTRLLEQSKHRMSTPYFLDGVGALLVLGGVIGLVRAAVSAIQVESFAPLLAAAAVCLTSVIVGLLCLSPATINIKMEDETQQGEDAIAILCLLPKCVLRVVPTLLVVGTVISSVYFLVSITSLFDDNRFAAAAEFGGNWSEGMVAYLSATLLPLGSYLAFLLLTLSLDLMRAVLVLPAKLSDRRD